MGEKDEKDTFEYNTGFGSSFESEALPNVLPLGQNNPQKCAYGLYAEQLSGTAFTVPRLKNQRSWLYRIRPSVHTSEMKPYKNCYDLKNIDKMKSDPNQLRWNPFDIKNTKTYTQSGGSVDFIDSLTTVAGAGDPSMKEGLAIHNYYATCNNENKAYYNSDGDFLIVPQEESFIMTTEFGKLHVSPGEIVIVPRGIKFKIHFDLPLATSGTNINIFSNNRCARGYILEIFSGHFELPNLGPIGANGLANPRDFKYPVASYEDVEVTNDSYKILNKFNGEMFYYQQSHSPFDVVGWHGNYSPYKYDLSHFCTMNSVSFDHPDPSIYTVLTCPSAEEGVAVADFVIFPPRWMVMEKTFRPPYYHRNCMSEYMGMVYGKYDAKEGFQPGGASLHSCMSAHGPDAATFHKASNTDLQPQYFDGGLAFMFETKYCLKLTEFALNTLDRDVKYQECWKNIPNNFNTNCSNCGNHTTVYNVL